MTRVLPRRIRLQKLLADTGIASRRHAEEMILAGRVLVNDEVVDTLPAFVTPGQDRVVVDGGVVHAQRPEYFLVHKPRGVICSNRDPAGRPRAVDLLPPLPVRLFPVGRLDADSSGLLLMTNDGELAERITHPRYGIPKTYRVEVRGRVGTDLPAKMRAGVYLAEGKASASDVRIVHSSTDRSALMITLHEGRNRQVRRMLARLGHPVKKLKRVQIGPLSVRGIPVGGSRRLTLKELDALRQGLEEIVRQTPKSPPKRRPRRGGGRSAAKKVVRTTGGRPRPTGSPSSRPGTTRRRIIT